MKVHTRYGVPCSAKRDEVRIYNGDPNEDEVAVGIVGVELSG